MAGPINPIKIEWDWPQVNADGSPLTDLKEAQVEISTNATGPWTLVATVPAPAADPAAGAVGSSDVASWNLTTDGQYYACIRSVDTTGNSQGRSTVLPFARSTVDALSPMPPSNPRFTVPALLVEGVAADNVGVTSVRWSNDRGGEGTAAGTETWAANVPLQPGQNVITVTAFDAAGNQTPDHITVTAP